MPYTTPEGVESTAHVWLEEPAATGDRPLCGADLFVTSNLVRIEEVYGGPRGFPQTLREWVLGSSSYTVCRECAELMVEEVSLHHAPIQWIPQVGRKRTRRLKDAGVESIHDVVKRYLNTDVSGSGPVYATGHLMDQTGMSKGGARQVLNNVAMERWRKETESRGIAWLIEEVRRGNAPHVSQG